MRVLLEQEYEAVAGGDSPSCEQTVKTILIVSGAIGGGLGGGGLPGAILGGTYGSLVADATAPFICAMGKDEDEEEDEEVSEEELAEIFEQEYVRWSQNSRLGNSYGRNITGPHQLVVDHSY